MGISTRYVPDKYPTSSAEIPIDGKGLNYLQFVATVNSCLTFPSPLAIYFPIQNFPKMVLRTSAGAISPVMLARWALICRR